jgi:hypothetical protein
MAARDDPFGLSSGGKLPSACAGPEPFDTLMALGKTEGLSKAAEPEGAVFS